MLYRSMKMNANPGDVGGGGNTDPLFDPPAPTTTPPPAVPPVTPPAPGVPEWQKDWPEELRNAPFMKNFKGPLDVAQAYAGAQKLIGADKIAIPKNATKEDITQIMRKLGSPEKLEEYKYDLAVAGSVDPDFMAAVNKVAYENGVHPIQAKALMDEFSKLNSTAQKQAQDGATLARNKELAGLREQWGDTYPNQIARARGAMSEFMPKEDIEALQKRGLGGDPVILRLLASVGATLTEDKILGHGGSNVGAALQPHEAQAERMKIMSDFNGPYFNPAHPEHQATKARVQQLFEYEAGKSPATLGGASIVKKMR